MRENSQFQSAPGDGAGSDGSNARSVAANYRFNPLPAMVPGVTGIAMNKYAIALFQSAPGDGAGSDVVDIVN